jgi:hypothetical protein
VSSFDIRQHEFSAELVYSEHEIRIIPRLNAGFFNDDLSLGKGRFFTGELESAYRRIGKGELRANLIVNTVEELEPFSQPEFAVTDGKRFGISGEIRLNANYELGRSMRINVNARNKVFENRAPELSGRGELVASF